jgi:asparagine synthase (glutamine-hydrolysing)
MCGIIAVFDSQAGGEANQDELSAQIQESLGYIAHRGPDASSVWVNENASCGESHLYPLEPNTEQTGLGHCRLAINDLSPDGEQPLHSPDGLVHAVVNGEIYDYDTIREQITSVSSYPFKGHSDSELVVALYLIYGRSFLHHLRGEFSLVIYDQRTQTFLAARDRYGIKPLFWRREGGRVMIAAEIKAFLGMGWKAEWDVGAIVDGGWGQDTRTVFKGVQKVSSTYRTRY